MNEQKIIPITVSYGDGDGPEIMEHILTILQHAGARISINSVDIGENFYKREHYNGIPDSAWKTITSHPVIFMAPSKKPAGEEYHDLLETLCRSLELHTILAPLSHQIDSNILIGRNEIAFQHNIAFRLQPNVVEEVRLFTDKQTQNLVRHASTYATIYGYEDIHTISYSSTALSAHRLKEVADTTLSHISMIDYYEFTGSLSQFIAEHEAERSIIISQENGLLNSLALMPDAVRRGMGYLGENYILFTGSGHRVSFEGQLHAAILMLISLDQSDIASLLHRAWEYALTENETLPDSSYDMFASALLAAIDEIKAQPVKALYSSVKTAPEVVLSSKAEQSHLVGVELIINHDSSYEDTYQLAQMIEKCCEKLPLKLQSVSSRGFPVWPNPSPYLFDANDYIAIRFMSDKTPKVTTVDEIELLLRPLADAGVAPIAMRQLMLYDEHIGFSF